MELFLIKPSLGLIAEKYNINKGSMEPLQLAVLASLTPEDVYIRLFDDRVEKIPYNEKADLVAITADTFTARRAYQIAIDFRRRGVKVVLGGIHPSLMPDEAKVYADSVIVGDAEKIWPRVIMDFKLGKLEKIYHAEAGLPQNSSLIPRRSLFKKKPYVPISLVQFSRGCRYNCSYCSVASYFKKQHHCRHVDDVVKEIQQDKLKNILFVDDNIVADRQKAMELFKALIPLKIKWAGQATVDMAEDPELLDAMAESGCVGNLIGFESINQDNLKQFKKAPNLKGFDRYKKAIDAFRDRGFLTWASFMIGGDYDTPETIEQTVQFAKDNKFALSFFHILSPYPGTKLYEDLKKEDRLLFDGKWWLHQDFRYNTAVFKPKLMAPEELSQAAVKANKDFYEMGSIFDRLKDKKTNFKNLGNLLLYLRFNFLLKNTSV